MQPRILIVDDNQDTVFVLNEYFNDEGFQSQYAGTGRDALRKFRTSRPEILVTDYLLPDIDGVTLVNQCRALSPHLKVIYITGVDIIRKNRALRPGPDCKVIQKPARPREIVAMMKAMLLSDT